MIDQSITYFDKILRYEVFMPEIFYVRLWTFNQIYLVCGWKIFYHFQKRSMYIGKCYLWKFVYE